MDFPQPTRDQVDIQEFTRPSTVTNTQWIDWWKPEGISMIEIFCVGGGGGGGGGRSGAATTARGGGGGGGSSGHVRVFIPAVFVPERLFVQVGAGGIGTVSGGGTAGSGLLSYVAVAPNNIASNIVAISGNVPAVGGVTGTAASGTGGAASTVAQISSMPLCGMGHFAMVAGQAGTDGTGTNLGGVDVALPLTGCVCLGGASAGSLPANGAGSPGGAYALVPGAYVSEGAPPEAAASGNDGGSGPLLRFGIGGFLWSYGGCGGSSSDTGTGGKGGNGNFGAGGGGGAGGITGGRGGDGGSGYVCITCWG